jgi:hypothetical protein
MPDGEALGGFAYVPISFVQTTNAGLYPESKFLELYRRIWSKVKRPPRRLS